MGFFTKDEAPAAPDMSGVANAAKAISDSALKYGQDAYQWAKDQFANNRGNTDQVVDNALKTQDINASNAAADRQRYEDVFVPQQDKLIQDANTYASDQKKDLEVGKAQSAVGQQFDAARNNATQSLESYGVNPAATRFGALDIGTRLTEAAAKAAAGNTAIQQTDQTARDLRAQAINMGASLPGQANNELAAGTAAGTSAVNNDLATTASGASTLGTNTGYLGVGNSATANQGNIINQGYQNQLGEFKANQTASSGIGSALGAAAGIGMTAMGMPASSVGGGLLKKAFSAEGGAIPEATPGGAVPAGASPTAGAAVDDVPAQLTAGEFVIPKDVAAWKGGEFFQKLIAQSRKASTSAPARPAVGDAPAAPPAFQSRPQGAVPAGA